MSPRKSQGVFAPPLSGHTADARFLDVWGGCWSSSPPGGRLGEIGFRTGVLESRNPRENKGVSDAAQPLQKKRTLRNLMAGRALSETLVFSRIFVRPVSTFYVIVPFGAISG